MSPENTGEPRCGTVALDSSLITASATYAPVLCLVDYAVAEPAQSYVSGFQGVQLGMVDVFRYEGVGLHRGDRRQCHVDADRLDDYLLTLPLRAHIELQREGRTRSVVPGQFALLSTSQPFIGAISGTTRDETFSALHVRISGTALRQRLPHAQACCWQPMSLRPGAGVMLQQIGEMAVREGQGLTRSECGRFASMMVDAVTNAIQEAPEVMGLPILSGRWTHLRIAQQAKAYIEAHLPDPRLDTDTVAAHCRVSKRYVQSVFAEIGETVGGTIRELRLQRCREDLRNPALRQQTVTQVAMHWGFFDMPNFCRAYRARFDQSPSGDRQPRS